MGEEGRLMQEEGERRQVRVESKRIVVLDTQVSLWRPWRQRALGTSAVCCSDVEPLSLS